MTAGQVAPSGDRNGEGLRPPEICRLQPLKKSRRLFGHASTAYGYNQQGQQLPGDFKYPTYAVKKFVEKPDEKTAQQLLRMGNHSWNSGMFIWKAERVLAEFQRQMPELHAALARIAAAPDGPTRATVIEGLWYDLKVETIDYGIMEHAEGVAVLPAGGLGWSDVGSWDSLFEVLFPDPNGNVSVNAPNLLLDTHNTLVYGNSNERLIVTIGLDDTVIVDSGDVLMVCKSDQSQRVRDVVDHLKKHNQERFL